MSLGLRYILIASAITAAFVNFISCGSQMYKVDLTSDHTSQEQTAQANSNDPNSPEFGLHAPKGWTSLPIGYYVDKSFSPVQTKALQAAMATWELATGKKLFKFNGVRTGETGDSFPDLYSSLGDNINGQYNDNNWAKTGKGNNVLATTIWNNRDNDYNYISTADIRYNSDLYFIADALTMEPKDQREIVDMQSLALHELGHLLGLTHISPDQDSSSIMNPSLFIGVGLATRSMSADDIGRIQKIYGCGGTACDKLATARTIMQAANAPAASQSLKPAH